MNQILSGLFGTCWCLTDLNIPQPKTNLNPAFGGIRFFSFPFTHAGMAHCHKKTPVPSASRFDLVAPTGLEPVSTV